ncbi:twin transmembrane helix small protein [Nitrosococcus wardiae]|uniref:Twin transmembrane helix small protein n=1 Tax=Nitrosococcus wardiae TaxID=1814290 RepID=A0A4P7BZ60_9GAMM|nr:twin transmembrane helix small protein [Nitrosococcus wardiae]QBQ53726.1 twin transmembrane helix small protein [Nitrosococcus wardiae]
MIFKLLVIALLISILYALGSALFALIRSGGSSDDRMVKALTFRIALSLGLFILLMLGYATGLITPNTIVPAEKMEEIQSSQQ